MDIMIIKCVKCDLHKYRKHIIVGVGDMPADILFLGEAPSMVENLRGTLLIGDDGKILSIMLNHALSLTHIKNKFTFFFTNMILCRPCDGKLDMTRDPEPLEVLKCSNNITKIISEVKPSMVVFVGKLAEQYYKHEFPDAVTILKPSYLLRQGGNKSPHYLVTVRILQQVIERINNNG